jgi:hypothetical protein
MQLKLHVRFLGERHLVTGAAYPTEMNQIIRRFGITIKSKALSSYSICKIFIYDYF